MWNRSGTRTKGLIWANSVATATGAETTSLTPSLPNGGIGMPTRIKASGSVASIVVLNVSNSQQIVVLVNPNAPPAEEEIPAGAFPGKQGSVAVTVDLSGAGTVYVAIGFAP